MIGKPKFTPEEEVALAQMRDDPELDGHVDALAARLQDMPHHVLRNMCAGFILAGTETYEEAEHAIERILAVRQHGLPDEEEPS